MNEQITYEQWNIVLKTLQGALDEQLDELARQELGEEGADDEQ